MEQTTNSITVRGNLLGLPEFSHENHGRKFYRFMMEVPRLSGAVDTLPVVASEQLIQQLDPIDGDMICVTGQIRSHNLRDQEGRHLLIFIFGEHPFVKKDEPPVGEL